MRNITDINKRSEAEPIKLYLESMLNGTPEKIKEKVTEFNQMVNHCIEHGKQYTYVTAEQNGVISYDELMILEDISNQSKKEIKSRNAETNVEKARVIENVVAYALKELVYFTDDDFYTSCGNNLIEALKVRRGSCCHVVALNHYLHLRNNMYSDLIRSKVDVEAEYPAMITHIFNLLFLDDQNKNWTFVDTMWEKQFLRIRDKNRFSFVSLEDIQSEPHDEYGAHMHIIQDISSISTISIDMQDIDRELGYHNKFCLYQLINDITWYIKYEETDEIKNMFGKGIENWLDKNKLIQYIGLVSTVSALELGNTGLQDTDKKPDESARIYCLDTYLKELLPTIYITLFSDRVRQAEPSALEDYNSQVSYLSELFKDIRVKDGSIGIHVDDMIDQACINIDFNIEDNRPCTEILNSIQFEEKFGIIKKDKSEPELTHEIAD